MHATHVNAPAPPVAPSLTPDDFGPEDLGLVTVMGDVAGTHARTVSLDRELLLQMYRELLRVRVLDTRMVLMQRQGLHMEKAIPLEKTQVSPCKMMYSAYSPFSIFQ